MKTNHRSGMAACAAAALLLLLSPAAAFAGATPVEQSADQIQTLGATQSQFWREFDSFVNSSTPMPLMEVLRRMSQKVDEEPSRLSLALAWSRDKISVKDVSKINSLYFLIYSDMAQRSALAMPKTSPYYLAYSKSAYQSLVEFELLFAADAAHCVNPDAGATEGPLINPRYTNLKYVEDLSPPEEMESYWKTALTYEASVAGRPGNAEICSNGVGEALAQVAGHLPPERVDPTYVDDAKWAAAREQVRTKKVDEWQKDYASIRKTWEARKAYYESKRAAAEAAVKQKAADAAAKQAADAEAEKAATAAVAKDKQDRAEKQKKEQGKYHDTFVQEPSHDYGNEGGGGSGVGDGGGD